MSTEQPTGASATGGIERTGNRSTFLRPESLAMRVCRVLGFERVAWSLRRLHCPVPKDALVLEVGSGGNPYPRANVLLDAYENTRERNWAPLKSDRPTVLGFVEQLPFRDKAFDFVIASHVLEHSGDPEQFLAELQRVAKAGYIEVPDAFFERINPLLDHHLEITQREGRLLIRKKPSPVVDRDLVDLYEDRAKRHMTGELFVEHPFAFHVRYYWRGKIDFVVLNPQVDAAWFAQETEAPAFATSLLGTSLRHRLQKAVLNLLQAMGRGRRRQIDLHALLRCPACGSDELVPERAHIHCTKCNRTYPIRNGVPVMQVAAASVN
ncbi:methyltransferase domain-containing protein [Ramlibacter albus]|uniref:Methyltransferase domain-containing protein n=1 Tax=Ramlibacter albus TaxID=2079448 RepID=A0A923MCR1_9BURK|nr:methyltransferase domain-containing protein [Ramlibacter albus]MBC5766919.1 methyltransferase domain-containing protein [Ramlibacter albus]